MNSQALLDASERWFALLLCLYPRDFRDEMGRSFVETYRDRAREALLQRGVLVSRASGSVPATTRYETARASGRGLPMPGGLVDGDVMPSSPSGG